MGGETSAVRSEGRCWNDLDFPVGVSVEENGVEPLTLLLGWSSNQQRDGKEDEPLLARFKIGGWMG